MNLNGNTPNFPVEPNLIQTIVHFKFRHLCFSKIILFPHTQ